MSSLSKHCTFLHSSPLPPLCSFDGNPPIVRTRTVTPTVRENVGPDLPLWCDTPAVNLNHRGIGGSTVHSINLEIRATVASLT